MRAEKHYMQSMRLRIQEQDSTSFSTAEGYRASGEVG